MPGATFARLERDGAVALGRAEYLAAAIEATAPGRGAETRRGQVRRAKIAGAPFEVAIRHYRRGGLFGRLLGDVYGPGGFARAARELALYATLEQRGVDTLEPLAVVGRRALCGIAWRLDLLTRAVEGAESLGALFDRGLGAEPPCERAAALEQAGAAVRALFEAGIDHPDLNLHNLLVEARCLAPAEASQGAPHAARHEAPSASEGAPAARPGRSRSISPRVRVIDLDRARASSQPLPDRARWGALARLWRSARKLGRGQERPATRADAARFLRGYAPGAAARPLRQEIARQIARRVGHLWLRRLRWRLGAR